MASNNVLIFGPTGNIGAIAAITAHTKGAKVFLAMRDPSKPIRGLSPEAESAGNYERIQADMTKPNTIIAAVQKSQAKSAFFYVAHGSPDHMESSIRALKSAGVDFVVFLSSYTIDRDVKDVQPAEIIPYIHAQVEAHLDSVYGPHDYVAVRPGGFATNTLRWKRDIASGLLQIQRPGAKFDYITPTDMGRVSGSILAAGRQRDGEKHVYLFGPAIHSQEEAAQIVAEALGKRLIVNAATPNESLATFEKAGMPTKFAKYMCSVYEQMGDTDGGTSARPVFKVGQANAEKYGGHKPTPFEEWVHANIDLYDV